MMKGATMDSEIEKREVVLLLNELGQAEVDIAGLGMYRHAGICRAATAALASLAVRAYPELLRRKPEPPAAEAPPPSHLQAVPAEAG